MQPEHISPTTSTSAQDIHLEFIQAARGSTSSRHAPTTIHAFRRRARKSRHNRSVAVYFQPQSLEGVGPRGGSVEGRAARDDPRCWRTGGLRGREEHRSPAASGAGVRRVCKRAVEVEPTSKVAALGVRTGGVRGREEHRSPAASGAGVRRVCKRAMVVEPTSKVAALGVKTGGVRCGEAEPHPPETSGLAPSSHLRQNTTCILAPPTPDLGRNTP